MKKLITVFLSIIMCISFLSCQSEKEVTKTEPLPEFPGEETVELIDENDKEYEVSDDENYTPLLYKVSDDDGSCIWLFGSVHYGFDNMIPLPDYVIDAYISSDALAVECDVIEAEKNTSLSDSYSYMYLDGTTIKDHISPELYEKAAELLENSIYGYSTYYETMKPVVWWELLELSFYEECGTSSANGIDRNLLKLAKEDKKQILEIESAEFQLTLVADLSPELQELLLRSTVESLEGENIEDTKNEFLSLIDGWYKGDAEMIAGENEEDYEGLTSEEIALVEKYNKVMLDDRNIGMTEFAVEALENDEAVFICVGAAHVVGENAMAELLEERGYTVEIIKG